MLVLGKGRTQGLEHTLTAEKMYSVNFTVKKKKSCLSLHYNGINSWNCSNSNLLRKHFKRFVSRLYEKNLDLMDMLTNLGLLLGPLIRHILIKLHQLFINISWQNTI